MMVLATEIFTFCRVFICSFGFFFLSYFLGIGLTRLLLSEESREVEHFLAPWVGLIFTGVILAYTALLGWGIRSVFWIPLLLAALLLGLAMRRYPASSIWIFRGRKALIPAWFLAFVVLFGAPPAISSAVKGGIFISIGNNDPFSYVMATQRFLVGKVPYYIKTFDPASSVAYYNTPWMRAKRRPPPPRELRPPTSTNNSITQIADNPRWLPLEILGFLSRVLNQEPEEIFALLNLWLLALFFPTIFLLSRKALKMEISSAWPGLLLCALSPHILFITLHGFLPQVMGTGFYIAFLSQLPDAFEENAAGGWRKMMILYLMGIGVLSSYFEILPYLVFSLGFYGFLSLITKRISPSRFVVAMLFFILTSIVLCPYQISRLQFLTAHLNGVRTGWQVSTRLYFLALPLGIFKFYAHMLQPIPVLEWVFSPFLLILGILGFSRLRTKTFFVSIFTPFVLAAAVTFLQDYNYAYFKNLSYNYFILPLIVGAGISSLRPRLYKFGLILFLLVPLIGSVRNDAELMKKATRYSYCLLQELSELKKVNADPRIDNIYMESLGISDLLWSAYYLKDKKLGMREYTGLLDDRPGVGTLMEERFPYIFERKCSRVFDPTAARQPFQTLLETPHYRLSKMSPPNRQRWVEFQPVIGTWDIENNGTEEWLWMGRSEKMTVESGGDHPQARLQLDLFSLQDQNMSVILDGKVLGNLELKRGVRSSSLVPFPLKRGKHALILMADREPPPFQPNDPRVLSVQIFKIWLVEPGLTDKR